MPLTSPAKDAKLHESHLADSINTFNSILEIQTKAIHHLVQQYRHSHFSQDQLKKSLNILNTSLLRGGKIVISGIGKSHKIAAKTVATLNSLSIHSALLHPSEALHGDLGILRKENNDCLILISSSGKSPELLQLLPHISLDIPIVLLTNKKTSILSQHFQIKSLLYAELPPQFTEESIYGLTAPTISTTLCLTLADAVSIALMELHISDKNNRKKVFGERHPGGAIGEAYFSKQSSTSTSFVETPLFSSACSLRSNSLGNSISPTLSPVTTMDDEELLQVDQIIKPVLFDLDFEDQDFDLVNSAQDHELNQRVRRSKNVGHFSQFFKNETEILSAVVLYDFVVFSDVMVVSTDDIKSVYRAVIDHQYESSSERINELSWRIKERLTRYVL